MKNVIATFTFAALSIFTASAQADGFICENDDGTLRAAVYNQTQPSLGTRNAAIMVLSNPTIADGRKTVATFTEVDGLLSNESAIYHAKVDLRFAGSARKGENIGGTKLGSLKQINLVVAHNALQPVAEGTITYGYISLVKRNGDVLAHTMTCARYLKGE